MKKTNLFKFLMLFSLLAPAAQARIADQTCCNNIPGYGAVFYQQSCAHSHNEPLGRGQTVEVCDSWVTTHTAYMQGGSCPGTSGTCQ